MLHTSCQAFDACLQAISWLPEEDGPLLQTLTRWNACLAASAFAFLCGKGDYWQHCQDQLTEAELAAVQAARQPPIMVLAVMSHLLRRWVGWLANRYLCERARRARCCRARPG